MPKYKRHYGLTLSISLLLCSTANADDFSKLDQALPASTDAYSIAPVFDFDTDGCLPSAGISRTGQQNGGLKPSGGLTSGCRDSNFLNLSNTYHRYACKINGSDQYCAHFYALYFLKDQILNGIQSGHRHDWENVVIWTKNGTVTHGSYSAHGNLTTRSVSELDTNGKHIKFVYHKDGLLTHAFRFSKTGEVAENPYGYFVTPDIVSWYTMYGDQVSNDTLRNQLNRYDYGSANVPVKDGSFLSNLNRGKPDSYPQFSAADVVRSR
ncbi:NPP1 family protein [Vibrio gazogenes]|uniref:Necrosis inducing protein (NPP1) n=1 Tax=Vibrio gazogenes DSM 21264 = NBRC 103151 TaxID=1123492 RepID=A0A1M4Y3C3_VIBGA|nr:NPP1 family protein [Vibrio gazogenes]USP12790.1 NPP1 family protein [Vibrio gazogenes]SHF00327.1 Necrosis inducing protein (NPP1) [Vibrio gazogenes DSM 21264] [Vibrio gazogenes DSM 21264 = NBRC 103151]SJN56240.1 Necrosis inducing protein (NPP1) [Vibrio gazogenes]